MESTPQPEEQALTVSEMLVAVHNIAVQGATAYIIEQQQKEAAQAEPAQPPASEV